MASTEDTKLMFNIILLLQSIDRVNKLRFLYVIKDLTRRVPEPAQPSTGCVRLPTDKKEMKQYITEESNSIFDQLPYPDIVEIKGHICIPIDNIMSNHLAMGIDIEYTATKYPGDDRAQDSKTEWIHGTEAMQQLLQRMMANEPHSDLSTMPTRYAWFLSW